MADAKHLDAKRDRKAGRKLRSGDAPREPRPPFPPQHQERPGSEAALDPAPRYEAQTYRGADKLLDRVALITGGDSGIGRAVAVLYAREGADVAIVYLSEDEDAEVTKRAVEAEGRSAILIRGDVSDPELCVKAVERTVHELGRLDVLVNNAAYQQHVDDIEDLTVEQWQRTFRTNIPVWTPLNPSDQPPEEVARLGQDTPMKRPAQPEEIAPAFVFLAAGSDSSYITGHVLPITGGEIAK